MRLHAPLSLALVVGLLPLLRPPLVVELHPLHQSQVLEVIRTLLLISVPSPRPTPHRLPTHPVLGGVRIPGLAPAKWGGY